MAHYGHGAGWQFSRLLMGCFQGTHGMAETDPLKDWQRFEGEGGWWSIPAGEGVVVLPWPREGGGVSRYSSGAGGTALPAGMPRPRPPGLATATTTLSPYLFGGTGAPPKPWRPKLSIWIWFGDCLVSL